MPRGRKDPSRSAQAFPRRRLPRASHPVQVSARRPDRGQSPASAGPFRTSHHGSFLAHLRCLGFTAMTQEPPPPPGWYHDFTTLNRRRYWDGTAWTSATKPPPTTPKRTVVVRRVRRRVRSVHQAIARHPKLSAVGSVAVVVLLIAAMSPDTPTRPTPVSAAVAPEVVPVVVMPNVVGMTGKVGQEAIRTATDSSLYASLVDAVAVGCTKLALGDAPIVRTDPPVGAELVQPSTTGIGGLKSTAVLFVDRTAGAACDPPPPAPPGNTYINPPNVYVDPPNVPHPHKPRICKHTRWC